METIEPWSPDRAERLIAACLGMEGPLLPVLRALQDAFGCVPREAVPLVAQALNISRAEVHGVVTFYSDFRQTPPGRRRVQLCRAEACQARGGEAAARFLLNRLALPQEEGAWGGDTANGAVTVEAVYCLGLCAVAPAALIDGEPLGRIDGARLAAAVEA